MFSVSLTFSPKSGTAIANIFAVSGIQRTVPPTITTQPQSLDLIYGYTEGSVSVTAQAADGHTITGYQWYSNTANSNSGGTVISGATSASYSIPTGKNASTTEYYYCVVTATRTDNNKTATTTSNVATVTVSKAINPLTYIATQSVNKTFCTAAQTATLAEASNGVGDVGYAIQSQMDASGDVNYFTLDGTTLTLATSTPAGSYTVVVRATAAGDNNYNSGTKDSTVTVTVGVANSVVTKAPTAKSLTYTGSLQELVTAGEAEGGEIYYELGEDAVNPPSGRGADTSIPTASDAGTYYVWYKVIADANHNDSEPVCIKVVIQSAAYAVLKVDNADYTIGSGQNTVITVKRSAGDDRTFSLYTGATMDGTPIASGNCDTAPGSLILTLKSFYLDSLSVGDHKLTISFQDGSVDTTVKILPAASVPTPTPKPVPKTGDSANPALWLAMMLVALIGFAGLAVTGTMKASRKKK